jgi:hypothetical protein
MKAPPSIRRPGCRVTGNSEVVNFLVWVRVADNAPMPSISDNLTRMSHHNSIKALSILLLSSMFLLQTFGSVCVYKPPTIGHFRGRIMDRSDFPISQAQVTVLRGEEIVQQFTTGESGEFKFDSIADGKYQIDVRARGFQHARYIVKLSSHRNAKRGLRITLGIGDLQCRGSIEVEEQTVPR